MPQRGQLCEYLYVLDNRDKIGENQVKDASEKEVQTESVSEAQEKEVQTEEEDKCICKGEILNNNLYI